MAITIHNVEINFDVKGSDEQRFGAMFARAMRSWTQQDDARRRLDMLAENERALGDRPTGGAGCR
jgi:hypothetical protein